jgi:hypothetical protein
LNCKKCHAQSLGNKGHRHGRRYYTTVPGKIKPLLIKIKDVGIPTKVTTAWLKSIGFTSSNDSGLIGVLKLARLIDDKGVPTTNWQKYRGPKGGHVLAQGIQAGYPDLFAVYPDAHARPNSDLENVFNTNTSAGKQVIQKAIGTFKNLVAEADFSEIDRLSDKDKQEFRTELNDIHSPANEIKPTKAGSMKGSSPSLHIDVQIHISSDATADKIDQIFASMSKHLYSPT